MIKGYLCCIVVMNGSIGDAERVCKKYEGFELGRDKILRAHLHPFTDTNGRLCDQFH